MLHTLDLLPHKGGERKGETGLFVKPPYHSLFLVTPLSLFSPCPEAIWGHSYPKIHRRIKKKKKSPEDPISFIKETALSRFDDNGANLIPWLLPRSDIMLRNVCLL